MVDFEEKEDKVLVTVKNAEGQTIQYRAQYVVAADAGKLSTPKLGINMEGITGLVDFVSTHFKADLSRYWDGAFNPVLKDVFLHLKLLFLT